MSDKYAESVRDSASMGLESVDIILSFEGE